jgi:hypothetical protein
VTHRAPSSHQQRLTTVPAHAGAVREATWARSKCMYAEAHEQNARDPAHDLGLAEDGFRHPQAGDPQRSSNSTPTSRGAAGWDFECESDA